MAYQIRQALAATGKLTLYCPGMSYVGLGLTGSWTGTVKPFFSQDGVSFASNPLTMTPFPSGTTVQSMTANGSWYTANQGFLAVQVQFTRLTGTVLVNLAASLDSSYQNAFLAPALEFPNSVATAATNTLTQAAVTGRACRLRNLIVSVLGGTVTWAAQPALTIKDGTTLLWAMDLATTNGAVYNIPLPPPSNNPGIVDGGLTATLGAAMAVVVVSGGASVQTNINAQFGAG